MAAVMLLITGLFPVIGTFFVGIFAAAQLAYWCRLFTE
jgi:hypothetical protein